MPIAPESNKRPLSYLSILLTSLSIILIAILLLRTPTPTTNFPLLTLNTTSLTFQNPTFQDYTTPNVYTIYLRSHCTGYYWNHSSSIVGLSCFPPSLTNLPYNDPELTTRFTTTYLPTLHAAFALYILSLILLGASLLAGLWYIIFDELLWKYAIILLGVGDILSAIASILTTTTQRTATPLINKKFLEAGVGAIATYDNWFLALSWMGLGFGIFGVAGWVAVKFKK